MKRQAGSYCQSQPVGERLRRIAGRWGQLGEGHHALTLRRLPTIVKVTNTHLAACECGALPSAHSPSVRQRDPGLARDAAQRRLRRRYQSRVSLAKGVMIRT